MAIAETVSIIALVGAITSAITAIYTWISQKSLFDRKKKIDELRSFEEAIERMSALKELDIHERELMLEAHKNLFKIYEQAGKTGFSDEKLLSLVELLQNDIKGMQKIKNRVVEQSGHSQST